jgi:hypothetical protein
VLVPNRKAVIELLRSLPLDDIVEWVPSRFAPEPYLARYRAVFFAHGGDRR